MEGAKQWLEKMKYPFPLYIDEGRSLYKTLDLSRSVAKAYHTEPLSYYGSAMARNEPIPESFVDIRDDPQQIGGDFIVSKGEQVVYSMIYRSTTASDRPSMLQIQEVLKKHRQ